MKFKSITLAAGLVMLSVSLYAQQYSAGPRHIGEEVLDELLMGRKSLLVRVGSGGCTGKGSFRVDVKKTEGMTPKAPHYILTINRTKIDECKAIFDGGTPIFWDLEKDLGLKGDFTFSVRNMVYSVTHPFLADDNEESFLSIVKKHLPEVFRQAAVSAPNSGAGEK